MAGQGRPRLFRYAAELAVIFFGVWLSLLAEDYRQRRLERAAEKTSVEGLLRDFQRDLAEMQGNLERAVESEAAARWIIEHAEGRGVDPDSLAAYLTKLNRGSIFVPNTSEYTALRSSGQMNIIQDAEFRQEMTRLYESYPFLTELHIDEKVAIDKAIESIATHVRFQLPEESGYSSIEVTGDADAILGNPDFLLQVGRLAVSRGYIRRGYEARMRRIRDLQALGQAFLQ